MTIDPPPIAGPSRLVDPILRQVAESNTFECDWETLRDHIRLGLQSTVPLFVSRGPCKAYAHPRANAVASSPTLEATRPDSANAAPPSDSLLLSPDRPTTSLDGQLPPKTDDTIQAEGEASAPVPATEGSEFKASTPGGLVIPPFPPLDPNRKRGNGITQLGSTSGQVGAKVNGHVNRFDDEWDEEVVIGGKLLPGWMEEKEGKEEVERLTKMLNDLDEAPFTIQRIAELLIAPTSTHSSLGKFLRAVEKCLLVTSPWERPSYTPQPISLLSASQAFPSTLSVPSSPASSVSADDEESMMPRGSATPMFSPIAFLPRDEDGDMDVDPPSGQERKLEDGLMSPLMLGGETSPNPAAGGGFQFAPSPQVRSPTPEPEPGSKGGSSPQNAVPTQSETNDPGHQSYLGRVDELDTGPVPASAPQGPHAEAASQGAGEGGNMVQHRMSEKPVPLSSTTVVKEEERKIAPRPKSLEERFTSGSGEDSAKDASDKQP